MIKKLMRWILMILVVVLVLLQAYPYGRDHTNPDKRVEPKWNSPRTRELAVRACFDCHSNETRWPWYSHVAPASWLIQSDVESGRKHLNFSEFDRKQKKASEAYLQVASGDMPPWFYLPLHAEARLTDAEKDELMTGLDATFGDGEDGEDGE